MTFCLTGISTLIFLLESGPLADHLLSGGFSCFLFFWRWSGGSGRGDVAEVLHLSDLFPQELILQGRTPRSTALWSNGTLVGLGLAAYAAAGVVFTLRDIPAAR